ncbi:MAG: hypothetical protein KY463_10625 [Actinobacteria bacterium]|nr:hypothetical protein [Actinomycetota bacterium]
MSETVQTYRRRRLTAVVVLVCLVLAFVLALRACGGNEAVLGLGAGGAQPATASDAALPGGGRRIFPDYRVVAFYGAPQDKQLGALGIGKPDEAAARLRKVARAYERKTRPVLPAFELIATIAADAPGEDGMYRMHQPDEVIARYLRAARRAKALLILDIQPGRADFLSETRRLERWLREPDVGIALDPEWHVKAGEVPGQALGSVTAAEINAVSAYVSSFVSDHDLPDKLFVVHQFTSSMIENKDAVQQRLGLALTMNVDGFGDRANKVSKYDLFTSELTRFHNGFKLFYEEDTNLMSPRQVLALRPPPDLVVYE